MVAIFEILPFKDFRLESIKFFVKNIKSSVFVEITVKVIVVLSREVLNGFD